MLDNHLPLRDREKALKIRRDWPTLGDLWDLLRNSAELGLCNIPAIRRACRQLAPHIAVEGLHGTWNAWLHRAKNAVEHQLESYSQVRLFYHLFPRHRPTQAEAELDGRQ